MNKLSRMRIPFPALQESAEFERGVVRLMHALTENNIGQVVPLGNSYSLHHGTEWSLSHDSEDESSDFKALSVESSVSHERFANNDLTLLGEFIDKVVSGLTSQCIRLMYETVGTAADKVGNTINAAEYATVAEAVLAMMKKIEFTVKEDGTVSLPEFHLHPDNSSKFLAELRRQPPSFGREVQVLKAYKKISALEKELQRQRKFFVQSEE